METEIIVFPGVARAGKNNELSYPVGEKHAVLAFFRQPSGTAPDWEYAAFHLGQSGWTEIEFQQVKTLEGPTQDTDPKLASAYEKAQAEGSTVIPYSGVV